jgi:transcriptional regulator with GAF, ATPase, and Fis domain
VEILQRQAIENALQQHQHNQASAARSLGLDPSNLRKLMQRLSISARKA